MTFIVEARHIVVWLGFEIGAAQPSLGLRVEEGQASASQKIVNEGCYEDGLAGARQAGHAKPHGRAHHVMHECSHIAQNINGGGRHIRGLQEDLALYIEHGHGRAYPPLIPAA